MVGETFGSYKVVGKIGEGGMGAVYLAEHSLIGRRVAIKVLLPEHSRNQDLIDRFFNEAKTAASLRHPALVEVFDFGIHPGSGSAYLVMDYLEGESLATRLTTVAPFSNELTMDLGRQLARGMEVAHRHGIVHRDLKPENIFLVPDADDPGHELVKIIDFGIAKLLPGGSIKSKSATSTGMLLGTPLYMAPEQCRGSGIIDHRADIYALGCILYAMLCGRPPFVFDGVGEILAAHMFQPAPALRTLNPEVSEALEALVMRTLAKDPAERPQTMAVLAIELGRLGGHHSQSMPATRPSRDGGTQTLPATATTFSGAAPVPAPLPPPPRPQLGLPIGIAVLALGLGAAGVVLLRPRHPVAIIPLGRTDAAVVAAEEPDAEEQVVEEEVPDAAAVVVVTEEKAEPVDSVKPAEHKPERQATHRRAAAPAGPRAAEEGKEPIEAFNRGMAHLARGQEGEALIAFRAYLRGEALNPARRTEAERYLIGLQRKFGEIEVSCDFTDAVVEVDGRYLGRTPLPSSVVMLTGTHQLVVTKDGYQPIRKSFTIGGGERKPFFFHLAR